MKIVDFNITSVSSDIRRMFLVRYFYDIMEYRQDLVTDNLIYEVEILVYAYFINIYCIGIFRKSLGTS